MIKSSGEPALIVGCGTGRLLLEHLADELDVDGMDLTRMYRTIIIPSSSFQLVPDLLEAEKALEGIFEHLLPVGTLVLSIWYIKSERSGEWCDWFYELSSHLSLRNKYFLDFTPRFWVKRYFLDIPLPPDGYPLFGRGCARVLCNAQLQVYNI